MFFFVSAVKRQSKTLQWILVFSLLYLCWGWMSLLWSVDPFLTARRLVAFTLVWLASIGFGAGFYGSRPDGRRLFLHHVMVAGVLAALALVVPWILRGGLGNVLDPAYVLRPASDTYSLVANPALIATLVMIVTPLLNLRRWRRYDWLLLLVLGLAVFVLKTRGPFLAAVLALGVVYLCYKIWSAKWLLPIGLLLASSYSVYILHLGGTLEWLLPYLTRNEGYSNVSSLTGRLPLWETVIFDAKQHLLGGVGFGAYWNPSNLARIEQIVGFTATVAENGYLDELLATGIIGLSLLLTFWTYITVAAIDRIRHGDNFGWIVVLFVVFYLLQNATFSIMQQYLQAPFIVLLILAGLMVGNRGEEPHYPVSPSKIVRHTPM